MDDLTVNADSSSSSPADLEKLMEQAIGDAHQYDTPAAAAAPESGAAPAAEPFVYEAPRASSSSTKGTRRTMGIPVPPSMAELFTPDSIGRVFTTGLNSFYLACEAAPLSEEEDQTLRKMFAYYMQARMPESAGRYQPELLLVAAIGASLVPRLPQVAPRTAPLFSRVGSFLARIIMYPFRRSPAE